MVLRLIFWAVCLLGSVGCLEEAVVIFNAGSNITLNCEGKGPDRDVAWIQYDKKVVPSSRIRHEKDGRLVIDEVFPRDEGRYTCQDAESNQSIHTIRLRVRSPPQRVANFTVLPRSVFALATWNSPEEEEEEDYSTRPPILSYRVSYRPDESHERSRGHLSLWKVLPDVRGDENSVTIYSLKPNFTYYFRIYAINDVGPGENVSVMARTKYDPQEVRQAAEEESRKRDEKSAPVYDGDFLDSGGSLPRKESVKSWVAVLVLFAIIFSVGGVGVSLFAYKYCKGSRSEITVEATEEEAMELVPHITLNPSFNIDMLEYIEPEESSINEERSETERRNFGDEEEGTNLFSLPNG